MNRVSAPASRHVLRLLEYQHPQASHFDHPRRHNVRQYPEPIQTYGPARPGERTRHTVPCRYAPNVTRRYRPRASGHPHLAIYSLWAYHKRANVRARARCSESGVARSEERFGVEKCFVRDVPAPGVPRRPDASARSANSATAAPYVSAACCSTEPERHRPLEMRPARDGAATPCDGVPTYAFFLI